MNPHPAAEQARAAATNWTAGTRYYEYTSAANPQMPQVPIQAFPAGEHAQGPTRVIPFDLSAHLKCDYPATTPNLMASFLRVLAAESLETSAAATSQLFYVIRGAGRTEFDQGEIGWAAGDLFVLPAGAECRHTASAEAAIYWVHDAPLLCYLGVQPTTARFRPTHYRAEEIEAELQAVAAQPGAAERNRRGILFGNEATPQTLTVTHTLWSLLNVLPARSVQKPHRHNSVALDLCVSAGPETYTLIGTELAADGQVANGQRAYWQAGAAFVTPPGWWHSHHNESDEDAIVLPIQDAGLCTYMRTLDIRFSE